jgi:hypothetical protein
LAKRWVLSTETKGTGAEMVPLDKVHDPASANPRVPIVVRDPQPLPEKPVEPRGPRRFKVVDVMTRQVLAEDVSTRETVAALADVRSVVDVNLYLWDDDADDWYQLSQHDRRLIWDLRGRLGSPAS